MNKFLNGIMLLFFRGMTELIAYCTEKFTVQES